VGKDFRTLIPVQVFGLSPRGIAVSEQAFRQTREGFEVFATVFGMTANPFDGSSTGQGVSTASIAEWATALRESPQGLRHWP
jgi:hypothetical protein